MPVPVIPLNSVPAAPGIYPLLGLVGNFSTIIPNPGRVYMIGTGSTGVNTPVKLSSVDDLLSIFGNVPQVNRDWVTAFFQSVGSLGELFYVRVNGIVAPASITVASVVSTLNNFNPERDTHGYVVCPEGYYHLLSTADRLALFTALESFVSLPDISWVHVADASPPAEFYGTAPVTANGKTIQPTLNATPVNTIGTLATNLSTLAASYVAERATYNSAAGHSNYACNPAINLFNRLVPASIGTVVAAQLRYAADSFRCAPAGTKAPLKGVIGVYADFNKTHQSTLNAGNANLLRLVRSYGVCMMGARTCYTQDSAMRFIHVRVIFNVIMADLWQAYQPVVFDPIDGLGITFAQAKGIATQRLVRFWQGGVLFGQTAQAAFKVVCDTSNNPAVDLENGDLRVDVFCAPCATSERTLLGIFRVPIGAVPQ